MVWLFTVIGILNLVAVGYACSVFLAGEQHRNLRLAWLTPLLGLIATSIFYFGWINVLGLDRAAYLVLETLVSFSLVFLSRRFAQKAQPTKLDIEQSSNNSTIEIRHWVVYFSLIGVLVLFAWNSFALIQQFELGGWDAWSRINLKASFMSNVVTSPEAFGRYVHHPDYPLMLPSSISRMWFIVGSTNVVVPQILSVAISLLLLLAIFEITMDVHCAEVGLVAVVTCLASVTLWHWAGLQYTDLLLSVLICVTTFSLYKLTLGDNEYLGLYFVAIGGCAWCKNEGVAFAAISGLLTVVFVIARNKDLRSNVSLGGLVGGLMMFGCLAATFGIKLAAPGNTDLFKDQSNLTDKLFDIHRYQAIGNALLAEAKHFNGFVLLVCLVALTTLLVTGPSKLKVNFANVLNVVSLTLLSLAFGAIYLITPHDLEFHLSTSIDRLVMLMWPPTVLTALLCTVKQTNGEIADQSKSP